MPLPARCRAQTYPQITPRMQLCIGVGSEGSGGSIPGKYFMYACSTFISRYSLEFANDGRRDFGLERVDADTEKGNQLLHVFLRPLSNS